MSKKNVLLFFLLCSLLEDVLAEGNSRYVNITEYPYHVSIQKYGKHLCSGAFIHESWIITVASCVFRVKTPAISVRVSSTMRSKDGEEMEISRIVIHEKFDKYVHFNDIALIKLKVPAQFGEKLLPIGLPESKNQKPDDGTTCFVTGWKQYPKRPLESQLVVTAVPVVNQDTCILAMPRYKPVSEKMLCAGNMKRGVETCQGDSGAPLMEGQTLIGVLSYGLGCKTMIHPGVYTRISSYLPWISANSGIRHT